MNSKDDDDFYEILGGGRVHDADPKTAKIAGALRGALLARQERPNLAPLRLPTQPTIKKSQQHRVPLWWIPVTITVSLLVGILIPTVQQHAQLESREKSFPPILEFKSSEPENMAKNIQQVLQAAGIDSAKAQEDKLWVLEFKSPINNSDIVVEIRTDETKTTP